MNTTLLRDIIMLGIGLVLSGVLIWGVADLGKIGYAMLGQKETQENYKEVMQVNRSLQVYNDYIVSRDDVLLGVKKFSEQYRITIQGGLSTRDKKDDRGIYVMYDDTDDIVLTEDSPKVDWNIDVLSSRMEENIELDYLKESGKSMEELQYHARLEYEDGSDRVTKITFTLEKTD